MLRLERPLPLPAMSGDDGPGEPRILDPHGRLPLMVDSVVVELFIRVRDVRGFRMPLLEELARDSHVLEVFHGSTTNEEQENDLGCVSAV